MRRGKGGESTKDLLRRLRREIPNLTLRTTVITGMPGETEDDFKELEIEWTNLNEFISKRREKLHKSFKIH